MNYQETLDHIQERRHTEQLPDLVQYNNSVRESWIHIWSRNLGENYSTAKALFKDRDCNIGNIPKKPGQPVLILGSGPSLDDWAPHIKEWKHDIFCSTSQLAWCEYHGVTPSYVFLIDADPNMVHLMERSAFRNKVPLISHPQVPASVFRAWGGKMCSECGAYKGSEVPVWLYRMFDPACELSNTYLPMMYGWMNEETNWKLAHYVMNAGNVVNNMASVAQALAYAPLVLAGYDLGYPNKQWRFTNYEKTDEGEWKQLPDPGIPEGREVYSGNDGILMDRLCTYYKYSFMIMYGVSAPPLLTSARGSIVETPYLHPSELVTTEPSTWPLRSPWECYQIARRYLHPRGVWVFKGFKRGKGAGIAIQNKREMKWWRRPWYGLWCWAKGTDTFSWPDEAFHGPRPWSWWDTARAIAQAWRKFWGEA